MPGGKRAGAGRKAGPGSVMRRVPLPVLAQVDAILAAYRQKLETEISQKSVSEIEHPPSLECETEIKDDLKFVSEINQPVPLDVETEIKQGGVSYLDSVSEINSHVLMVQQSLEHSQAVKDLEKLPNVVLKQLRKKYGTLRAAVRDGVRRDGKAAVRIPSLACTGD